MEEGAGPTRIPCPHAALSKAAEVYFNAIQKIGEQALQSSTSQILGEALPLPPYPPIFLGPEGALLLALHLPQAASCGPGPSVSLVPSLRGLLGPPAWDPREGSFPVLTLPGNPTKP